MSALRPASSNAGVQNPPVSAKNAATVPAPSLRISASNSSANRCIYCWSLSPCSLYRYRYHGETREHVFMRIGSKWRRRFYRLTVSGASSESLQSTRRNARQRNTTNAIFPIRIVSLNHIDSIGFADLNKALSNHLQGALICLRVRR